MTARMCKSSSAASETILVPSNLLSHVVLGFKHGKAQCPYLPADFTDAVIHLSSKARIVPRTLLRPAYCYCLEAPDKNDRSARARNLGSYGAFSRKKEIVLLNDEQVAILTDISQRLLSTIAGRVRSTGWLSTVTRRRTATSTS
jgi:hypothetical protein